MHFVPCNRMNTKAYIEKNFWHKQKPVWTGKRQVLANVGQLQRLCDCKITLNFIVVILIFVPPPAGNFLIGNFVSARRTLCTLFVNISIIEEGRAASKSPH